MDSPTILRLAKPEKFLKRPRSGYTVHLVEERHLPCVTQDKLATKEDVLEFVGKHLDTLPRDMALSIIRHDH